MKFEEYLSSLPVKRQLSEVKQKILKRLWHKDNLPFPRSWVSSEELLNLTGQKYFDRRARELRDQLGCDIETEYREEFAGHAWRITSVKLTPPLDREYLTQSQKNKLFKEHNYCCAVCGTKIDPGVRGLQADHKVPLSRGGSNDLINWQPLCNNCNVGKRRACEGCELECLTCSWAFPETVGIKTLLSLSSDVLQKVDNYAASKDLTRDKVMEDAAVYYIDKKTDD